MSNILFVDKITVLSALLVIGGRSNIRLCPQLLGSLDTAYTNVLGITQDTLLYVIENLATKRVEGAGGPHRTRKRRLFWPCLH